MEKTTLNPRSRDRLSSARRSWNMSRIRGKDTNLEMIVRRLLHKMGFRFRLHVRIPIPPSTLNSKPSTMFACTDLLLPKIQNRHLRS